MAAGEEQVVARVTPAAGGSVAGLLGMPLGLDVWERSADSLVVAAPESRLAELERRRLAHVERWGPARRYLAQLRDRDAPGGDDDRPR
ncbi:hypothetical protein [Geodermatophilus sp. TF02-6]|uniref:hypothetical protein n=1 Tax=Geodermatophilus sp. TF02-6 TaxID=2250575 RepID=UPI0018F30615|nr:hypothetical protein [Geodermatophilus sp. TF02-6]